MALSLEDSNLVWQKAKISLESLGADSVSRAAFKALKEKLASVGGNPTLQFVPISATDVDDANGVVLANAACTLYGVFLKKSSVATAAFTALLDDDTDDASPVTDTQLVLGQIAASQKVFAIYPDGMAFTVGLVAKTWTEFDGTTDAADTTTPNGFVIIAAA